jgi:hypothetical protein
MKKITPGYINTSAAYTINKRLKYYQTLDKPPEVGDLVYGRILQIGQHSDLENRSGRIHSVTKGSKSIFVFGNRYAPDCYEGVVPSEYTSEVDLLARSGVVGIVKNRSQLVKDATKVKMLGYICDEDGSIFNTRKYCLINPKEIVKKPNRSKLILVVGSSMNAGKSAAAAACCWALSSMGHDVRASKITGTASLKDILKMQDSGASVVNDFTHFGYPSTYLLDESELLRIFNDTDLKYANNSRNYWVVEIADGILQRETKMLLSNSMITSRIHKLIFSARDALGAISGVQILKSQFNLVPDAISGIISSLPLGIREMREFVDLPVFDSMSWNLEELNSVLI